MRLRNIQTLHCTVHLYLQTLSNQTSTHNSDCVQNTNIKIISSDRKSSLTSNRRRLKLLVHSQGCTVKTFRPLDMKQIQFFVFVLYGDKLVWNDIAWKLGRSFKDLYLHIPWHFSSWRLYKNSTQGTAFQTPAWNGTDRQTAQHEIIAFCIKKKQQINRQNRLVFLFFVF